MAGAAPEALLIVDVQNDFCAGGALEVADGDAVVPVVNRLARAVVARGGLVFASRDWHPRETRHFAANGGTWPVHCVAGTPGAQFHPGLDLPETASIVTTGDTADEDGYSAFTGYLSTGERFVDALRAQGIRRLVVAGLATDYCVKQSVLEACRLGLDVVVVEDGIRAVDAMPGDGARALQDMVAAGAAVASSSAILAGPPDCGDS
jgi:nicotinamidase/pyrazinamidase